MRSAEAGNRIPRRSGGKPAPRPVKSLHGVLLAIDRCGVLITGPAGIGKSELALELIARGHRLVVDDGPRLQTVRAGILVGSSPAMLRGFLYVRGFGLMNIRAMYGPGAIKSFQRVAIVVRLVAGAGPHGEAAKAPSREAQGLGPRIESVTICGVRLPGYSLPAEPGRRLAILVEAVVRDYRLRAAGQDPGQDFVARQRHWIEHQAVERVE